MTKIKICGLTRAEDIDYANQLKPEYIGFVFADFSSRFITPAQAFLLKEKLESSIKAVGVFWDHPLDMVADLANKHIIDVIQLHHNEDEDYINMLKQLTDTPIIKGFKITCSEDIKNVCRSTADFILLDNHIPGSGQSFDWSLIQNIPRPFFLAGGLSPDNIDEALKTLPYAVDVSSGVETNKVKDYKKMKDFIHKVRQSHE